MLHLSQMTKLKRQIGLALLPLLASTSAFAINSINVQTFNPSTSDHFVFLEDGFKSEWPKHAKYYFGANYNFVNAPLIALDGTQSAKAYNIIDSVQTFDLFFGFKAANNLGLFIGAPIHFISYSTYVNNNFPLLFPNRNTSGFGDLKLMAKIRLTDDTSNTSVAIIPEFHLPTGSTENFVSDASTYVGARIAIERQFESWTLAGNVGYASASNSIYADPTYVSGIDYRKRLILGIGGFFPLNDLWGINAEFKNINMIPFDRALNPNDAYLGVRYAANDGLIFTGGASLGKIGGPGGSDARAVVGIRYTLFDDTQQKPQPLSSIIPAAPAAALVTIIESTPRVVMQAKRIEILRPIMFENDSYKLMPDSKQTLDDVATLMLKHKDAYNKVLVDGHTSSVGTDKYNISLSIARARAVKTYIVTKGVAPGLIEARGFGRTRPKIAITEPNAADVNRRVEFIIVK